jgi:hypothetical protein
MAGKHGHAFFEINSMISPFNVRITDSKLVYDYLLLV